MTIPVVQVHDTELENMALFSDSHLPFELFGIVQLYLLREPLTHLHIEGSKFRLDNFQVSARRFMCEIGAMERLPSPLPMLLAARKLSPIRYEIFELVPRKNRWERRVWSTFTRIQLIDLVALRSTNLRMFSWQR
jgi:hypothetical protein